MKRTQNNKFKKPAAAVAPEPTRKDFDDKILQSSRSGWISPTGEFRPCQSGAHEDEAIEIAKELGKYYLAGYAMTEAGFIESKGWLRVSCCVPGIPEKAYRNDSLEWFLPSAQYDCLYALVNTHCPGKAGEELACFFFRPMRIKG